jgi:hypothetical protein
MDEIFTTIKNFILNDVNYELIQLAEQAVPLPAVTADNILFGTVDLSRYSAPVVVAVLPDNQEPDDSFIDGFSDRSEFVVTFLFQKALYPLLVKRMCRYAKAFRKALAKNSDMSDGVEDSEITLVDFFPDCGVVAQQMTACEINLAIDTEEKIS